MVKLVTKYPRSWTDNPPFTDDYPVNLRTPKQQFPHQINICNDCGQEKPVKEHPPGSGQLLCKECRNGMFCPHTGE